MGSRFNVQRFPAESGIHKNAARMVKVTLDAPSPPFAESFPPGGRKNSHSGTAS